MSGPGKDRSEGTGGAISRRRALKITALAGGALVLGGKTALELAEGLGLERVRHTRTQLGTRVTITVVHDDGQKARRMVEATFAEMERLEAILSRYRSGTPVSRLARDGVLRDPPAELTEVLGRALALSRRTDGAFDPTVAPLLELYAGRADRGLGLPDPRAVENALERVGYQRVRVDEDLIALEGPGMALTLDGIAKGYVVDRALATLVAAGAERVQVEAGGDLAASGGDLPSLGADGWRVAIQDPHDPAGSVGVLRVQGQGVATSGDYMQAFSRDRRHHHILDPRTGYSPEHTSGVTVVASSAMDADALSTAVFVLGPEKGLELLEETAGAEGMIVAKDGSRRTSGGMGRGILEVSS